MVFRTLLIGALVVAAGSAQPGPKGRGGPGGGPGGPGGRFIGAEVGMPGRVVRNAPYSADIVTESTQTLPDGNHIKQSSTVHVYRDGEGRTRHEQALRNLNGLAGNSNLPQVAFINDPVAGASYALDLGQRSATKARFGRGNGGGSIGAPPPMERRAAPAPGQPVDPRGLRPTMRRGNQNVKTESLGRQMVEGVQADGVRTTMTIPAGEIGNEQPLQVVTETWYSPELQVMLLRKRTDPRSGETVTRYMNVSRTEPPRTLFEVPADFKVSENARTPWPRQKQ